MSDPYVSQPPQPTYRPGSYSERYAGTVHDPGLAPPAGYSAPAAYGTPGLRASDKRPGTVTAAAVIAIVCCVLSMAGDAIMLVVVAVDRARFEQAILDRAADDPNLQRSLNDISAHQIVNILIGVLAVLAVLTAIALLLAVLVLKRSKVARVLLIVFSGVTALSSLVSIGSGVSAVTLIAAVLVIVLLVTGGANDWFARRVRPGAY